MKFNVYVFYVFVTIVIMTDHFGHCKLTRQEKLSKLRERLVAYNYDAYIIPAEDEHQSEYVAKYDKRRAWISDFTGSAGTAVVTKDKAMVWTDSRYYLQAESQLNTTHDKTWVLMKASDSETPSIDKWLSDNLQKNQVVAQNPRFVSIASWQNREVNLEKAGLKYVEAQIDLIDEIWPADERPAKPNTPIEIHDLKYAGLTWKEKLEEAKKRLKPVDVFVVTALDEVAWLLNLRASDIPYNPMLFGYIIIDVNSNNDKFYISKERITNELRNYLNGMEILDYNQVTSGIKSYSDMGKTIMISPASSYYIYNSVTNKNKLVSNKQSPIKSMKAVKTEIEIKNFRECQIRDSAARIRHMHWLETQMAKGAIVTEMTAADELERIQKEDPLFKMLSFDSISAVGPNAAVVHYSTIEGKNVTLTKDKIYLLDAGAQYLDCTTDITRTHHYGKPTAREIESYTKVLQGSIDLANVVFPPGVYGREIDVEARAALWRVGLDYGHGTGHGIGYYLSVHENPPTTSYNSRREYDEPFVVGMVQSDEPGYYEDGYFGIRLETDLETVKADTLYHFKNRDYLTFSALSLVPFDTNLIDPCLLTNQQVDWLNKYNKDIIAKVGPRLDKYPDVRKYLNEKTKPFSYAHLHPECAKMFPNNAYKYQISWIFTIAFSLVSLFLKNNS